LAAPRSLCPRCAWACAASPQPLLLLERMGLAVPGMFRDGPVVELQQSTTPGIES